MNILLLDKNIYYCKLLMNSMSALNKEIRISYIANSIEDLYHIYDMDIILADYEFYGKDLENKFEDCVIIYLSDDHTNELTISKNNIDLIIKTIEIKSNKLSEKYIENLIYSELVLLGYNMALLGTKCIIEALKIMYYSNSSLLNKSLINDVYPLVAEHLGLTTRVVKSNMNYATAKMLKNIDKEYLMQYSNYTLTGKVGLKAILHQILLKINHYN